MLIYQYTYQEQMCPLQIIHIKKSQAVLPRPDDKLLQPQLGSLRNALSFALMRTGDWAIMTSLTHFNFLRSPSGVSLYTSLWRDHFILVFWACCTLSGIVKKINREVEGDHTSSGIHDLRGNLPITSAVLSCMTKDLGIFIADQMRLQLIEFSSLWTGNTWVLISS